MTSIPLTLHVGEVNQPFVRLSLGEGECCDIYLHGAHVTSWISGGREQLFLSRQADFAPGKAIRGGVPVIFPQFGAFGPGAKHGFARNLNWQLDPSSSAHCARFTLAASERTLATWPFEFTAGFTVELEPGRLLMQLEIINSGEQTMSFTSALHTYLASPDYRQGRLTGVAGLEYWDNGTPWQQRQVHSENELEIADALDRVYFEASKPLVWQDAGRTLRLSANGFRDAVVWNPGQAGAQALSDMADDEFSRMLCVEAANVEVPVELAPGERWLGSQCIETVSY